MTRIASAGLAAPYFLFEVLLLGLLGGSLFLEDASAQSARPATVLVDVAVEERRSGDAQRATRARIHLRTDGVPPPPLIFALSNPTRLVIDLPGLASRVERVRVPVDSTVARGVRVGRHANFTRVVVDAGDTPNPFERWRLERAESGWTVVLGEEEKPPDAQAERDPGLVREELLLPRGGLPAVSAPPKPTRIYGVELEVDERRERVLIFAERGVTPEVTDGDTQSVVIDFPDATLDPSAPGHVAPDVGKGISSIAVFERGDTEIPTVRMVIERAGKLPPEVTRRGAIVALEFAEEWATSGGVTLEFRDAPLREVVEAISEVTGDRFIYDSLEGAVTVSAGGRITRAEAMELLHAALLMRGYAALQSPGGAYKILPIQAGSTSGPWQAADELSGAAPVTTLIQLRSVSPQRVVDALRGWLGQQLIALPFPRTNSVILSGSADRIRRILTVIHALDESSDTEFAIVRLRYRDAADAAALIENVQKEGERNVPEVFVDERSNALLVRATPQRLAEVRSFLRTIDRPLEGGGGIHVLRLHAADPEQIANVLNSLSQGSASEGALAESASALLNEEFQITVDAPTRSLLVRSSEETFRALAEVIAELDRIPPRIRLEVLVLELTSSGALSLGFDAFFPISNPKDQNDTIAAVLLNPSGGGLIQPGTPGGPRGAVRFTRAPLIVPIVNSDGVPVSIQVPRESFVVTADAEELQGRVLMRPNLLMVAGEEHELFAGANVPIPVERDEAEEALGQLQTTQDIERQDVGLRLRVTPTTGQRGSVRLDLQIEKTAVIDSLVGGNQSLGPSLQQRVIETTVTLQGEEYAIVALSEDERQLDTETGVPFLRDIPFLGFFFRATTKTRIEDQFVVAVRARALRGDLDLLADSARERIGFERNMERVEGLPLSMAAPFAVLAGTYTSEAEAARNASQIAGPEGQGQVVTWRWQEEERFDVVLSPYESIVEAAGAVNTLLDAGYSARIIAMPEAPARAAR